jgi:hypothetical protein
LFTYPFISFINMFLSLFLGNTKQTKLKGCLFRCFVFSKIFCEILRNLWSILFSSSVNSVSSVVNKIDSYENSPQISQMIADDIVF